MDIRIQVDIPSIERLAEALEHSNLRVTSFYPDRTALSTMASAGNAARTYGATKAPGVVETAQSADTEKAESNAEKQAEAEYERSASRTDGSDGFTEVPMDTVPWVTPDVADVADSAPKPITLDQIMKCTAQMRDDGLMPQLRSIIGVNGPYGIRMVSHLKPEQFEAFAADLRKLGGKI